MYKNFFRRILWICSILGLGCLTMEGLAVYQARQINMKIQSDLANSNCVRVVDQSNLIPHSNRGCRSYQTKDLDELLELRGQFQVAPSFSNVMGIHCMCDGDYIFTFEGAQGIQTSLSIHHGKLLRHNGRDYSLSAESSFLIGKWLAMKGFFNVQSSASEPVSNPKDGACPSP